MTYKINMSGTTYILLKQTVCFRALPYISRFTLELLTFLCIPVNPFLICEIYFILKNKNEQLQKILPLIELFFLLLISNSNLY